MFIQILICDIFHHRAREQLIELQDRNLEENPVKEEEPVVETETEVLVLGTESIVPPVEVVPEPIDQEIVPPTDTECHIQEEELPSQVESLEEGPAAPVNKINVFYKDGQNLDNCLVANYAKRVRRIVIICVHLHKVQLFIANSLSLLG